MSAPRSGLDLWIGFSKVRLGFMQEGYTHKSEKIIGADVSALL